MIGKDDRALSVPLYRFRLLERENKYSAHRDEEAIRSTVGFLNVNEYLHGVDV